MTMEWYPKWIIGQLIHSPIIVNNIGMSIKIPACARSDSYRMTMQEEKPINDFQNIRNLKNLADANRPAPGIHDLMGQKT
jgi:hypothetical protein